MKSRFIFSCLCCLVYGYSTAQTIKVDYITKVPKNIQQCGALYSYDTTALKKKKYIMLADFQNLGIISIKGKMITLHLINTELGDKRMNVATYIGAGGYSVVTTVKTSKQTTLVDYEEGTLEISKGKEKISIKIHGLSGCDASKMEGNGK